MIGTAEGCWFALKTLPDGRIDFEFYLYNNCLSVGICNENELWVRFDRFVKGLSECLG